VRLVPSLPQTVARKFNLESKLYVILAEQQLYKLYAQALADSEVTQDWSSWVEMMTINCQKCCSEAEISHPIAFRTGRQP
jgi:hypothetical protein